MLRRNGIFFGTTLDGDKVKDLLIDKNELIET